MYAHKPSHVRVATAMPLPDWSKLCRNDHVEIHTPGIPPMTGRIDMIAADHSVFWIIRNDGAGRTMLCSSDDIAIIKIPQAGRQHQNEAAAFAE